jgi:hypothetical protein
MKEEDHEEDQKLHLLALHLQSVPLRRELPLRTELRLQPRQLRQVTGRVGTGGSRDRRCRNVAVGDSATSGYGHGAAHAATWHPCES